MQLPPQVHGATVINAQVATSAALASKFESEVLPLAFTDSVANIGRPSLAKVVRAWRAARDLGQALIVPRPNAVYFTMAPHGTALPVTATREGALPEIWAHSVSGLLVPRHDPHELAAQLEVLLRDPVARHRMGQRARDRFVTSATLETFEANLVAARSTARPGASAAS